MLIQLLLPAVCAGCGVLLRDPDRVPEVCSRCAPACARWPELHDGPRNVDVGWVYQGALADAMQRLKFGGDAALAGPLGRALGRLLDTKLDDQTWDTLIPVPLHWRRLLNRGFNQAGLIAKFAAKASHRSRRVEPGLLRRIRATAPQTELLPTARRRNVTGAFRAPDPESVRGRTLVVVDDVTTTGATLNACRKALTAAGAREVRGVALLGALA